MGTYASKFKIVEAIQWTGDNLNEIIDFVKRSVTVDAYILKQHNIASLTIPYFRGRNVVNMNIEPYDYIVKGLNDSFYIMNKADFEMLFVDVQKEERLKDMQIIAGPRGSGKTTELIKLCAETPNSVIVCANSMKVNRIKQMAIVQGYKIPNPITISDVLHMRKDYIGDGNFLYDDVDLILSHITPINSTTFAATISDENMRFVAHGQDVAM